VQARRHPQAASERRPNWIVRRRIALREPLDEDLVAVVARDGLVGESDLAILRRELLRATEVLERMPVVARAGGTRARARRNKSAVLTRAGLGRW
jgi:hypothetical protein